MTTETVGPRDWDAEWASEEKERQAGEPLQKPVDPAEAEVNRQIADLEQQRLILGMCIEVRRGIKMAIQEGNREIERLMGKLDAEAESEGRAEVL